MGGVLRVLRGLAHRGAATLLLAVLAVVAVVASAAAPAYDAAARAAIVRSTLDASTASSAQLDVSVADPDGERTVEAVQQTVANALARGAGRPTDDLLAAPSLAVEATADIGPASVPLVWRSDVCAHLHLDSGRCPAKPGEALVSSEAAASGLDGAAFAAAHLQVVGVYTHPAVPDPAFFDRFETYFGGRSGESPDAVFVPEATAAGRTGTTDVVDVALRTHRLSPGQVEAASRAYSAVVDDPRLTAAGANVDQVLDSVVARMRQGFHTLAVPTVIATASLLVLTWLLLYLVVTEDVETRGNEIALARLRGLGRRRVLGTAVAEPLAVLVLAVPVGTLLGWLAAHLLARSLLGGTPVGLPASSWLASVVAVAGGAAAVAVAARRALARGVLDQWRATQRRGPSRAWVFDAVVVTAAVAGLVELGVTGNVTSPSAGVQVELVPSLLALAVATVLSRLLPPACRLVAARTGDRAPLPLFLALRHVGRRPGGTRSVMALASAVAIALFGVAAWSVGHNARSEVARAAIGAPTVLSVALPTGLDLDAAVAKADPSGHDAVGVDRIDQNGTLLAVDPTRFAAVASFAHGTDPTALVAALAPPVPAPVTVDGDAYRVTLTGPDVAVLSMGGQVASSTGPLASDLTATGAGVFTGELRACPCRLDSLTLGGPRDQPAAGSVTMTRIEVHDASGWHDLGASALRAWQVDADDPDTEIAPRPEGLSWSFDLRDFGASAIVAADRPSPLPALVSASGPGASAIGVQVTTASLDGDTQQVLPVSVAAYVPGAPASGVVVDRTYALRQAGGLDLGRDQVWISGDTAAIERSLSAQGARTLGTTTTAGARTQLDRQGPALAVALLLFDAVVVAVIAAVGAVVALVADGRRRRYEYAALVAAGARRSLVRWSLLLEQVVVLGFGLVVGIGTGIVGIALAVPRVPVLVDRPVSPVLDLTPQPSVVVLSALVGTAAVVTVAAVCAALLARSVRPAALREGTA